MIAKFGVVLRKRVRASTRGFNTGSKPLVRLREFDTDGIATNYRQMRWALVKIVSFENKGTVEARKRQIRNIDVWRHRFDRIRSES